MLKRIEKSVGIMAVGFGLIVPDAMLMCSLKSDAEFVAANETCDNSAMLLRNTARNERVIVCLKAMAIFCKKSFIAILHCCDDAQNFLSSKTVVTLILRCHLSGISSIFVNRYR